MTILLIFFNLFLYICIYFILFFLFCFQPLSPFAHTIKKKTTSEPARDNRYRCIDRDKERKEGKEAEEIDDRINLFYSSIIDLSVIVSAKLGK